MATDTVSRAPDPGAPPPVPPGLRHGGGELAACVGIAVLATVVGLVLFALVSPSSKRNPAQTPALWHVKVNGSLFPLGCRSKAILLSVAGRIDRYRAEGDKSAADKLLDMSLISGACTAFQLGEPVFIANSDGALQGLARVRRKGRLGHWWVFSETVAPGAGSQRRGVDHAHL